MFSYKERAESHPNPLARQLLTIMDEKQSNLCVAVDVLKQQELLSLADELGPFICVLKTHIDILEDFDYGMIPKLQELAKKHRFLIFEDRKFADIGNTVKLQYKAGVYKIASWAHITNCHPLPGEGIVNALKEVGQPLDRGLLLLAEMSSAGCLIDSEYTDNAVKMAQKHNEFVFGFIGQNRINNLKSGDKVTQDFILMTPGVSLASKSDSLGQTYRTPEQVIVESDSDIIIVGRGIYGQGNVATNSREYQTAGWNAYLKKIN